jgi:hypothetical protein
MKARSDDQLGRAIYGWEREEEKPAEEPEEPKERLKPRSDQELAEILYGRERNPRYPDIDNNGIVNDCIRDIDGRIITQGPTDNHPEKLLFWHLGPLSHADLHGMKLPELPGRDLRESNMKGATLGNLNGADLRGIEVDETTDISNATFSGAQVDLQTYEKLVKCKGFDRAKGLGRPLR